MTLVMDTALTRPWVNSEDQRSSIELEEKLKYQPKPIGSCTSSSGISPSAELIQKFIDIMNIEYVQWQEATSLITTPDDVEKEIVVLLPPIKSMKAKLHIKNINRPGPLIHLED